MFACMHGYIFMFVRLASPGSWRWAETVLEAFTAQIDQEHPSEVYGCD